MTSTTTATSIRKNPNIYPNPVKNASQSSVYDFWMNVYVNMSLKLIFVYVEAIWNFVRKFWFLTHSVKTEHTADLRLVLSLGAGAPMLISPSMCTPCLALLLTWRKSDIRGSSKRSWLGSCVESLWLLRCLVTRSSKFGRPAIQSCCGGCIREFNRVYLIITIVTKIGLRFFS